MPLVLRVAIACSWLNQYGGAERVLEVLHDMYPQAPVYTSIYWPRAFPPSWSDWDIRPSQLDRLPLIRQHHQWYLPLYPHAFEQLALSDYDLVLSVSSGFAHGIVTPASTLHICYCLTPARFLWDYHGYVRREDLNGIALRVLPPVIRHLRMWDRLAADRVDYFVAISHAVQRRIVKFYRRQATVIYPPVDVKRFSRSFERGEHFLVMSRLVPYKNIDLAVKAFNRLGLPLWIIGDGRDRGALESMAASNVRFLGRVDDAEAQLCLSACRAFILPGEEDFGIAPLEAQAAGRPVVALAAGGALETIVDGETGVFFHEPTADSLAEAVLRAEGLSFEPTRIRQHAQQFDQGVFRAKFADYVRETFAEFCA